MCASTALIPREETTDTGHNKSWAFLEQTFLVDPKIAGEKWVVLSQAEFD